MKYLHATSFCGLTDLRTGGLIIGYMSLIFAILNMTLLGNHWISSVPELLVTIPLLIGIHKSRDILMLPTVVFYIFELLVCILSVIIIIPVCNFFFWDETKDYFIEFASVWLKLEHYDPKLLMLILWLALTIGTALHWYCTAVIFSLYKTIKNGSEQQSNEKYGVPPEKA